MHCESSAHPSPLLSKKLRQIVKQFLSCAALSAWWVNSPYLWTLSLDSCQRKIGLSHPQGCLIIYGSLFYNHELTGSNYSGVAFCQVFYQSQFYLQFWMLAEQIIHVLTWRHQRINDVWKFFTDWSDRPTGKDALKNGMHECDWVYLKEKRQPMKFSGVTVTGSHSHHAPHRGPVNGRRHTPNQATSQTRL